MIETVFRDYLLQSAALTALVGTRVYQNRGPSNGAVYPLVVIRKATVDPTHAHDPLDYTPGHSNTRYMVLGLAKTFADLVALRAALRGLDGFSIAAAVAGGLDQSFQGVGTVIQSVRLVNDHDTFEGNETQLFKLSADFEIAHSESFTPGITVP